MFNLFKSFCKLNVYDKGLILMSLSIVMMVVWFCLLVADVPAICSGIAGAICGIFMAFGGIMHSYGALKSDNTIWAKMSTAGSFCGCSLLSIETMFHFALDWFGIDFPEFYSLYLTPLMILFVIGCFGMLIDTLIRKLRKS